MCTPIEENYELAAQRLSEAALIANKFKYYHGFLWATHHLAWVYLDQGNIAQAEEQCKIALEGNIRMDTRRGIADCYEQWGVINLAKGSKYITLAEENLEKSLNIRKSVNNPHGVASSLTYLALVSACDKLYIKALKLIIKSCFIYCQIGVLNITRLIRIITLFYSWLIRKKTLTM